MMKKLAYFFSHPVECHRKYHTWFMVGEFIVLSIASIILVFLTRVASATLDENGKVVDVIADRFVFGVTYTTKLYVLPIISCVVILAFVGFIIYIRDGKKNPIKAKKLTKPLLTVSIIFLIANFIIGYILGITYKTEGSIQTCYNHLIGVVVADISSLIMALDIYAWQFNFDLEKFYGSNDPVYK